MLSDVIRCLNSGATVLTPTRRLAQHVAARYDADQSERGLLAWPSADVLSWGAWIDRTLEGLLAHVESPPLILKTAQELEVWRGLVSESRPDAEAGLLARLAQEAWRLKHEWRLPLPRTNEAGSGEALAFSGWAAAFEVHCRRRGWVSRPEAAEMLLRGPPEACAGRPVLLYAFDELSLQQRAILAAWEAAGCEVRHLTLDAGTAIPSLLAFDSPADEYAGVAERVRHILEEAPQARIGIVVPDLAAERAALTRALDAVLDPWGNESPQSGPRSPVNVSLGLPLARWAPVRALLQVLSFAIEEMPLATAGELLRSPFLGASEAELQERALFDVELRRHGALTLDADALNRRLAEFHRATGRCRWLADRLPAWLARARSLRGRHLPSHWVGEFFGLLGALGWPGERSLDSAEHQVVARSREVLQELACLDIVCGRLEAREALQHVVRLLGDTVFQPESAEMPVQVVGVLESAGLDFDHLFVTGMTDRTWPPAPRPNPLLPHALQRSRGVPHADLDWERDFARRFMAMWSAMASRTIYSWPARRGNEVQRPSALATGMSKVAAGEPPVRSSRAQLLFASRLLERYRDDKASPLSEARRTRGGAGVLKDQSDCPFKAFARHRLFARDLEEGRVGPDPRERGQLVHEVLAAYARRVRSLEQLLGLGEAEWRQHIEAAVTEALNAAVRLRGHLMPEAYCETERSRLIRLLEAFGAQERARESYRVLFSESAAQVVLNGLTLRARPDRVDEIGGEGQEGRLAVIDYKTGEVSPLDWFGARPREPQLPLYALTQPAEVGMVAFVRLDADKVQWLGYAQREGIAPGVPVPDRARTRQPGIDGWADLLAHWCENLERLAGAYVAGEAAVDPRDGRATCKNCRLEILCRVDRGGEDLSVEPEGDE